MSDVLDLSETLITLTADIVSAHVSNNNVAVGEVSGLIQNVHGALTQLGQTDLVATSEADYIALAAALARDSQRLAGLRATLRPRMQASPVCQAEAFTAAHEALIRRMWRDWCGRSVSG